MQNLLTNYRFSYIKPSKQLPEKEFIKQSLDPEIRKFFYSLPAKKYISLEILEKLYSSQIIRVTLGQWILIIECIYNQILKSYNLKQNKEELAKITPQNIWIITNIGFNGQITIQNDLFVEILNYEDKELIKLSDNLILFSFIQDDILQLCKETEYRFRYDGEKSILETQQIIDIIEWDIFNPVQQCLYTNPEKLKETIDNIVDRNTQETQYEYCVDDKFVNDNYVKLIQHLNEIANTEHCQNIFEQYDKLMEWQKALFDQIDPCWNRQHYKYYKKMIKFVRSKIQTINENKNKNEKKNENENENKYTEQMKFDMELQAFKCMDEQGFFNFNSKKASLLEVISIKQNLKEQKDLLIKGEKNNDVQSFQKNDNIEESIGRLSHFTDNISSNLYLEKLIEILQYAAEHIMGREKFKEYKERLEKNKTIILQWYQTNCQIKYQIFNHYFFNESFISNWNEYLSSIRDIEFILNDQLEEELDKKFKELLNIAFDI